MQTKYLYKHYSGGVYQGTLDVLNEFRLSSEINTAASELTIDVPVAFEQSGAALVTDLLVDENGDYIITDNNERIILGTRYSITGFPNLNDVVEAYEINDTYPNGKLLFKGRVTRWQSDYERNTTRLTLLSRGIDLDNFIVSIQPETILLENDTTDGTVTLHASGLKTPRNLTYGVAQTFTVGSTTTVRSVDFGIDHSAGGSISASSALSIYLGTPSATGALVASVSRTVPAGHTGLLTYDFGTDVPLSQGQQYFFLLTNTESTAGSSFTQSFTAETDSTASFGGGTVTSYNDNGTKTAESYDLKFIMKSSTAGVGNRYLSTDPGAIATDLIDNYNAAGGVITYDGSSISLAGTTVTYTFKFLTFLDAIRKTVELAPRDWWFWVDPADELIYFQARNQTAEHTFVRGKHVQNITLEYSLEDMTNVVYFSGGDDGTGTNVLTITQDAESIEEYGHWLDKPVDNRVTTTDTAEIISEGLLLERKDPRFNTEVRIFASTYDITTIKVGDIVTFRNFNSLIDSLELQVLRTTYTPNFIDLSLDILPPTQSKRVEDIKRNLEKQQTENNPNT